MLRLLGLYSPIKVELMTCFLALLLALPLAYGSSGDVNMPAQDVPTPTPGPMSTDGPIWVAERLNGKPVIRRTALTLSTSDNGAWGHDGCNVFAFAEGGPKALVFEQTGGFPPRWTWRDAAS